MYDDQPRTGAGQHVVSFYCQERYLFNTKLIYLSPVNDLIYIIEKSYFFQKYIRDLINDIDKLPKLLFIIIFIT